MFAEDQVLLVRYADMAKYDDQSGWFLPDDELKYHIESFKGDSGAWHMSFHNKLMLDRMPRLKRSSALADAKWFELTQLPRRSEVAHHGWALHVLETMAKGHS